MKEILSKLTLILCLMLLCTSTLYSRVVDKSVVTYNYETQKYYAYDIPDFTEYKPVSLKKKRFIDFIYVLVISENNSIIKDRKKLLELFSEKDLTTSNLSYINNLEKMYNLQISEKSEDILWEELLERIDLIPFDLAVSQAACESGWGTSGFAQKANNLFGHWTYEKGAGLVPSARDEGKTHEIAIFKSVNDSIRKYMFNLNTNRAYKKLRTIRRECRERGDTLRGEEISAGLESYSGIGYEYVKIINSIIRRNRNIMGIR